MMLEKRVYVLVLIVMSLIMTMLLVTSPHLLSAQNSSDTPNLFVEQINVPSNIESGMPFEIEVVVRNGGEGDAAAIGRVNLYVDPLTDPLDAEPTGIVGDFGALAAGQTRSFIFKDIFIEEDGIFPLFVWVDSEDDVLEDDSEGDNWGESDMQGHPTCISVGEGAENGGIIRCDTYEPNDNIGGLDIKDACAKHKILPDGVVRHHTFDQGEDVDQFVIPLKQGVFYELTIESDTPFDESAIKISQERLDTKCPDAFSESEEFGDAPGINVTTTAKTDTTVVRRIYQRDIDTVIELSFENQGNRGGALWTSKMEIVSDCDAIPDFGDSCHAATNIASGTYEQTYCANVGGANEPDEDWVSFPVKAGEIYNVIVDGTEGNARPELNLYSACDNEPIAPTDVITNTADQLTTYVIEAERDGWRHVQSKSADVGLFGNTTAYQLTMNNVGHCQLYRESNNDVESATVIGVGDVQTHSACKSSQELTDDVDVLKFEAEAGETYHIETLNLEKAADTVLTLFTLDEAGNEVVLAENDDIYGERRSQIVWEAVNSEPHYLRIVPYDPEVAGDATRYDVRIMTTDQCEPEREDEPERGNETVLKTDGITVEHKLCTAGDEDWFTLDVDAGKYLIQTESIGATSDVELSLLDDRGRPLAFNDDGYEFGDQIVYDFAKAGTYQVRVKGFDATQFGVNSTYSLLARETSGESNQSDSSNKIKRTAVIPSNSETLILFNQARMAGEYGLDQADRVHESLIALSELITVEGKIIPLDQNKTLQAAYDAWGATGTITENVTAANDVANEIRNIVMKHIQENGDIKHIVVVGNDQMIPFQRIEDKTSYPETKYSSSLTLADPTGQAIHAGYYLSDDCYADKRKVSLGEGDEGGELFCLPDFGIGRLIETPDEIIDFINTYITTSTVQTGNALVTGYDFVADGAAQICTTWGKEEGNVDCLIEAREGDDKVWPLDDFPQFSSLDTPPSELEVYTAVRLQEENPYLLQSINGHATHWQEGILGGSSDVKESLTSDVIAKSGVNYQGGLIYSPACHAGLNVPPSNLNDLDLAQAHVQKGANYVGNTGYGWGSLEGTGLTEQLMTLYTGALTADSPVKIGAALTQAKRIYYSQELGELSPFGQKVLQQTVLYGLPMYEIDTPEGRMNRSRPQQDDPFGGLVNFKTDVITNSLDTTKYTVQLTLTGGMTDTETADGSYFSLNTSRNADVGDTFQPLFYSNVGNIEIGNVPEGKRLRGVVFMGGQYSVTAGFNPLVLTPDNEYVTVTEQAVTDGWNPSQLIDVQSHEEMEQLLIPMGQYGQWQYDDRKIKHQRILTAVSADLYYSDFQDQTAPKLSQIKAFYDPFSQATNVSLIATDRHVVERVVVAHTVADPNAKTDDSGTWQTIELARSEGNQWTGVIDNIENINNVDGSIENIQFFVQAVDDAGNVAHETNKNRYFTPIVRRATFGAADGCNSAIPLPTNGVLQTYQFDGSDDTDWFEFDTSTGARYKVVIDPAGSVDEIMAEIRPECPENGEAETRSIPLSEISFMVDAEHNGVYKLRIQPRNITDESSLQYSVSVEVRPRNIFLPFINNFDRKPLGDVCDDPEQFPLNTKIERAFDGVGEDNATCAAFGAKEGFVYQIRVEPAPNSSAFVLADLLDTDNKVTQKSHYAPDAVFNLTADSDGLYKLKLRHDPPQAEEITGGESRSAVQKQAVPDALNLGYTITVEEVPDVPVGAAVIVAGRYSANDPLQENIYYVTDGVHGLFGSNGYVTEEGENRLFYVAPEERTRAAETRPATIEGLEKAINDAVAILDDGEPLTIYMMSHGARDKFYLDRVNGEILSPDELDGWLDEIQEELRREGKNIPINIIIDACYSGSFISPFNGDTLAGENRAVITSATNNQLAWASFNGAMFSDHFLTGISYQRNMFDAYTNAKGVVSDVLRPSQNPWIDDDGNEIGDRGGEGQGDVAETRYLLPLDTGSDIVREPYIVNGAFGILDGVALFTTTILFEPVITVTTITGEPIAVPDEDKLEVEIDVWAILYPPSFVITETAVLTETVLITNSDYLLSIEELLIVRLTLTERGVYTGSLPLDVVEEGEYEVRFMAQGHSSYVCRDENALPANPTPIPPTPIPTVDPANPPDSGSIGGTIYEDNDLAPLSNIEVTLTISGDIAETQTTDVNGAYIFEELDWGEYTVTVNPDTLPIDAIPVNHNNETTTQLAPENPNDLTQDFIYHLVGINTRRRTSLNLESALLCSVEENLDPSNYYAAASLSSRPFTETFTALPGSIGGTVQNNDDKPFSDVILYLENTDNETIATTASDENGIYLFDSVPQGSYTVTVDAITLPDHQYPVGHNNSELITPGGRAATQNFVYETLGRIQSTIFYDGDGDSENGGTIISADGDRPAAGITVALYDENGEQVQTTTTNNVGVYTFERLPLDITYTISVSTDLNGVHDPNGEPDNVSTVVLTEDAPTNIVQHFSYSPNGRITVVVYTDLNGNSERDEGEKGIPGATVIVDLLGGIELMMTGGDGTAEFNDLPSNQTYTFTVVIDSGEQRQFATLTTNNLDIMLPFGFTLSPTPTPVTPTSTPVTPSPTPVTPTSTPVTPTSTSVTPTSAPVTPTSAPVTPTSAPVTPTSAPVTPTSAPVTPTSAPVTPTSAPVTPSPTPVTPTSTPVTPTSTPVTPSPTPVTPTSTPITPSPTPVTPTSTPITPSPTPITPTSAPITPSPTPVIGSITGVIFGDVNGNEVDRDPDMEDVLFAGVSVMLKAADNSTTIITTDANGAYLFADLTLGAYTISVVTTTLPTIAQGNPVFEADGVYDGEVAILLGGTTQFVSNANFSYQPFGSVNGVISARYSVVTVETFPDTEIQFVPLTDVTVALQDSEGNSFAQIVDDEGRYNFATVPLQTYTITVNAPEQYTPLATNDNTVIVTLDQPAQNQATLLYGISGQLGGTIYSDADNEANLDNQPNVLAGDTVRAGVEVVLYWSFALGEEGTPVATAVTDENGQYLFDNLPFSDYIVFVLNGALPDAKQNNPVSDPDGGDPYAASAMLSYTGTQVALNQNFSYAALSQISGRITEYTQDLDPNDSTEYIDIYVPLPDVTVTLHDSNQITVATTTTDENGDYQFPLRIEGDDTITYTVVITNMTNDFYVVDRDGGNDRQAAIGVSKDTAGITDADFTFEPAGEIGVAVTDLFSDYVYTGVVATLSNATGYTAVLTTTDSYTDIPSFSDLRLGTYTVTIDATTLPTNATFLPAGHNNVLTATLTLESPSQFVQFRYDILGDIGGTIFSDVDGVSNPNSQPDFSNGDTPLEGVHVFLDSGGVSETFNTVTSTGIITTNANGEYLFENVPLGSYDIVVFEETLPSAKRGNSVSRSEQGFIDLTYENPNNIAYHFGYQALGRVRGVVFSEVDGIISAAPSGVDQYLDPPASTRSADRLDLISTVSLDTMQTEMMVDIPTTVSPSSSRRYKPRLQGGLPTPTPPPILGSIGSTVFHDANNDGVYDTADGDFPMEGVELVLMFSDGTTNTTVTDPSGLYTFTNLFINETYTVTVNMDTVLDKEDGVTGNSSNIGDEESEGVSELSTTLTLDEPDDPTLDFGFTELGSIGSTVFHDADADGIYEPASGDSPLFGVEVFLLDEIGVVIDATTTDVNGFYQFTNIFFGTYTVIVDLTTLPEDKNPSATGSIDLTDDDTSEGVDQLVTTLTIDEPDDPTLDFGFTNLVSIGSTVFYDIDDSGTQEYGSELGIGGVMVTLLDENGDPVATVMTDEGGDYFFDGLLPGDYTVSVAPPADAPNSSTGTSGDDAVDGNDNGDQPGGSGTPAISSVIELRAGDEPTDEAAQGGSQDVANDDSGDMTIDFGFVPTGEIGDFIFHDVDGDGVYDLLDGDYPLESVVVVLTDDAGSAPVTATTDENGRYTFNNLPLNITYAVSVDSSTLPITKTEIATGDLGNIGVDDTSEGVTVLTAVLTLDFREDPQLDFAFAPVMGSIGSTVFYDMDDSGTQDVGEPGIPNVTVVLWTADNSGNPVTPITSTTTNFAGNYLFDELIDGTYIVQVFSPADAPQSSTPTDTADNGEDGDDNGIQAGVGDDVFSSSITLQAGTEPTTEPAQGGTQDDTDLATDSAGDMTVDFGFVPIGEIGNFIFHDVNGDGIYAPADGDSPLVGIVVNLAYQFGSQIAQTTTGENGQYLFSNLILDRTYRVWVDETTLPADKFPIATEVIESTADNTSEGTNELITTLTADNVSDLFLDFGYAPLGYTPNGTINGTVFHDLNSDDNLNGDDFPLADVILSLRLGSQALMTTTTDANGTYRFTDLPFTDVGLPPSTNTPLFYTVTIDGSTIPDDKTTYFDYRAITTTLATTDPLTQTIDFANAPFEADDPLSGVIVRLVDVDGRTVMSMTTGADGVYDFIDVPMGVYTVTVDTDTLPLAKQVHPVYNSDAIVDNQTVVTLTPDDEDHLLVSFSFEALGDIGGVVFSEEDGVISDTITSGDTPIPNATVELYESFFDESSYSIFRGEKIVETTTDVDGLYRFDGLPLSYRPNGGYIYTGYEVVIITPTLPLAKQNHPVYDPDGGEDSTAFVTIWSYDPDALSQNFSYGELGSIGGTIFSDIDGDPVNSEPDLGVGDTLLEAIVVTLTYSDGATRTTTTDVDGLYLFEALPVDNTYTVTVDTSTLPEGKQVNPVYDHDGITDNKVSIILTPDSNIQSVNFSYFPLDLVGDLTTITQEAYDVQVVADVAYIADGGHGLVIVDISDPINPINIGSFNTLGFAYDLQVVGNRVYMATGNNGLVILDVADPTNIGLIGSLDTGGFTTQVQVIGERVYIADGFIEGLGIIDVSNPSSPELISSFDASGMSGHLQIVEDVAYISNFMNNDGLRIVDISDPVAPTPLASYFVPASRRIQIIDNLAYITSEDEGLVILDVNDPTNPVYISSYETGGYARGLDVVDGIAYVGGSRLYIINVRDPNNPILISSHALNGIPVSVDVVGNSIYVAVETSGVQIFSTVQSGTY